MDEFKSVINSEEKNQGKGIQIFSMIFAIPAISLFYSAISEQSLGSLFGAIGFSLFVALMYGIGFFQKKKYNKLGATPLTLTPSFCTIGSEFSGSIEIPRTQFNKVKDLSITSWKYTKITNDSYQFEKVWESTITPTIKYKKNKTMLEFIFTIPEGSKPSYNGFFSKNKHHWEVSFEFVESMENIKRSWRIPVKI
ncbi:hypothetical protein NBRC116592_30370 [Colwellia sp. KU-HH00111]|uniref:hypothetical protein n=1 Tax=Colwellia sp. KU-HH00111 TaxID=3127652 RepID=UPI003108E660